MKALKIYLVYLLLWLTCLNSISWANPDDFKPQYDKFIKAHQYAQAIDLCKEALKEADDQAKPEFEIRLDEARRQKEIFDKLIKDLKYGSKKKEINLSSGAVIITKANEDGFEGYLRENKKERYKGKWADIPVPNIYGLFTLSKANVFDITKLKGEDKFNLAVWCFGHGLSLQAETVLAIFYQEQPRKIALINPLLARIRNIPLPEGGFALYNETAWITAETAKQRAEVLKNLGTYKGALDKPGADKENLSWEKAREKETEHFIVKTNLSMDALNDICFLLESAYFNYQDIFGFGTPKEKLRVMVAKNQVEYQKVYYDLTGTDTPFGGYFMPALQSNNKSKQDHLLCFYNLSDRKPLTAFLLHECTHYATDLVKTKYNCFSPPPWLNEGWATYYEASRLEGKRFVTNVINQARVPFIKDAINKQTYIKLKDFINCAQAEYHNIYYHEGWSLIYFLLNGQDGKYKSGLQAYMEAWKKGKIAMSADGMSPSDKPAHLKLFEECMGVSIDQLEEEWKGYILQLK